MMKKTAAILPTIIVLTSLAHAAEFEKPWYVHASRQTLTTAWQRLKKLEVPGVPTDSRFRIGGPSHYVSPNGDDTNPGTEDKPWRTLEKACASLRPGTVVYLMAGTYYGPATVKVQGTEASPAAIRAVAGAEVIITYSEEWIKAEANKLVSVEPSNDIRNAVVKNNIFWGPGKAFGVDHNPTDNLADYNCIAPEATVTTTSPAYTYGPHNIRANPGFIEAAALNFTLKPDSPCVDAGDPSVGAYCGKAPDIGLLEMGHP